MAIAKNKGLTNPKFYDILCVYNIKMEITMPGKILYKIDEKELFDYFITQNHSLNETAEHFNVGSWVISNRLKTMGVKKPKSLVGDVVKKSRIEKYGSASYNNREKYKQTCLEKYGVENPFQSEEIKEKSKKTNLEKLGVEYPMQRKDIQQKSIETKASEYGSLEDYYSHVSTKMKETKLERYGNENFVNSKKCKETKLERYGDENYTNQEKIAETNLERYGVPFACMREEARKSGGNLSAPNIEFSELLSSNGIEFETEFSIDRFSYDFKVGNILIEINPTATHNVTFNPFTENKVSRISADYHKKKSDIAERNGFRCIHIWDWDDKEKVVRTLLPRERVYARVCVVEEVSLDVAREYLNKYHLQGYARDSFRIGLFLNGELVSLMTFGKPRYSNKYDFELIRFCSHKFVVGGAEKLFKHFIEKFSPNTVVSYCDRNKFSGDMYGNLGFKKTYCKPSEHWSKGKTHILGSLLRQRGFDQLLGEKYGCYGKGTNNEELMVKHGFAKVIDAGQITFVWTK